MNAEFNVWLLIVGLVLGAGLVWLVLMDSRRHEAEIDADERPREAAWLSLVMAEDGYEVSPEAAERLLVLHGAYLGAPPPDAVVPDEVGEDRLTEERLTEDRLTADRLTADRLSDSGQRLPARTGVASTGAPLASTSETPNRAPLDTPDSAGTGPIQ